MAVVVGGVDVAVNELVVVEAECSNKGLDMVRHVARFVGSVFHGEPHGEVVEHLEEDEVAVVFVLSDLSIYAHGLEDEEGRGVGVGFGSFFVLIYKIVPCGIWKANPSRLDRPP